jgi:hypothetical protein
MRVQVGTPLLACFSQLEKVKVALSGHLPVSSTLRIILEPEKTDVAVKSLGKHILKTMNAHATKGEKLDVFSMRSVSGKILSMQ